MRKQLLTGYGDLDITKNQAEDSKDSNAVFLKNDVIQQWQNFTNE